MRIRWSPQALRELDEAAAYIAGERPATAERWLTAIFATVRRLERFPESGRVLDLPGAEGRRELLHGSYRIIYRTAGDVVEIIAIVHGRRELRPDDLDEAGGR